MDWLKDTRTSYDTVAESYADLVRPALRQDPYLRAALALFADLVGPGAPVADIGCGPGHVTAHLHRLGLDAIGIDLSPAMIELARRENPSVRFEVGDMTDLRADIKEMAGVIAFWSLIHIPDDLVPTVLDQLKRVLRPGGILALGFHVGDRTTLKTEGYGGHPMRVHVHVRPPERVAAWMRAAGFTVEAQLLISPETPKPGAILYGQC
ncbi:class I SAM-dependent DNA methyltransferase [Dactylosporangium sp. CS-033363]|uniref:class I SAM-dependent DNA methyltransferase n=1 Tax=Dactylosporangium sp. CS-033363 TaxID=3239935 RepID=UPI003D8EF9DC